MSELGIFTKNVAQDTRYFPTLIGALLVGLLLLFFKELSDPIKLYFLPSLVIYVIGTSFLAYLQSMLALRKQMENDRDKIVFTGNAKPVFWTIVSLHVLWLACFIWYNLYRGSI